MLFHVTNEHDHLNCPEDPAGRDPMHSETRRNGLKTTMT